MRAIDQTIEVLARQKSRLLPLDIELIDAAVFVERDFAREKLWPRQRVGEKLKQPLGILGNHHAAHNRIVGAGVRIHLRAKRFDGTGKRFAGAFRQQIRGHFDQRHLISDFGYGMSPVDFLRDAGGQRHERRAVIFDQHQCHAVSEPAFAGDGQLQWARRAGRGWALPLRRVAWREGARLNEPQRQRNDQRR